MEASDVRLLPLKTRTSPMKRAVNSRWAPWKKSARFSESPANLSAAVSSRRLLLVWSPLDHAWQSAFGRRCRASQRPCGARDEHKSVRGPCLLFYILWAAVRRRSAAPRRLHIVRLARCWAHPQRAVGRAAAPRPQIHHDAAAAPGRPPTARWLPNRGNHRASRRSCGRRHLRRATPHR